ncbi:MAG: DUF1365 domain-containing protein [Vicinamibacteria bacterium]
MSGHLRSALLVGAVMHRRLQPFAHGFRYPIYMHRLDLDELPRLDRALRLFGVNRWRPVSFLERDHLGPADRGLRGNVEARLVEAGVTDAVARIDLVTQCRVFGYVFNPVSFYFCYRADASLLAIVAEVHNTFGEQHCYVLPGPAGEAGASTPAHVWHDKKAFHVSPFLTLDGTYRFQFDVTDGHLDARIDLHRGGRAVFVSRLSLDARPLSDGALAGVLVRYPLMTLRVIAAIHWQAAWLWLKGAVYHPKPAYDPEWARTETEA